MKTAIVLCAILLGSPTLAGPPVSSPVEIHFAPVENLEHIDLGLLQSAKYTIDFAAYSLADRVIVQALDEAIAKGIGVRILIDASQHHALEDLHGLAENIRVKRPGPIMHLKSYVIDGETLRTGSANFSGSGLKHQDNDLLIIRDAASADAFENNFERIWALALPYDADKMAERIGAPSRRQANLATTPASPLP